MKQLKLFTVASMSVIWINACAPMVIRVTPPQIYATGKQATPESNSVNNLNPIKGGFGYFFGEVLDGSKVIQSSYTDNPLTQGYLVKPIVPNETTDYLNVEVCKRTNRIYSISGFKICNNKNFALRRLRAARQHIEQKYGVSKALPAKSDFYAEYVKHGPREIRLIATPGNFDPPKWGFSIMYLSDEHKQLCR